MLACPFCGGDYTELGLDQGRCRLCGGVVAWQDDAFDHAPSPDEATDQATDAAAGPGPDRDMTAASAASASDTDHSLEHRGTVQTGWVPPDAELSGDDPEYRGTIRTGQVPDMKDDAEFRGTIRTGQVPDSLDDPEYRGTIQTGQVPPLGPRGPAGKQGGKSKTSQRKATLNDADSAHLDKMWRHTYTPETRNGATLQQSAAAKADTHIVVQRRHVHGIEDARFSGDGQADYQLENVIGQGGVGIVFNARQASLDRNVAVKMLQPEQNEDRQQREKFLSEAVVTGELEHPNIVPIYDLGRNQSGDLFYSMKYVRGTPWSDVMPRLTLAENLEVLFKVADAIAFAHSRSVIHRDIKPENVMIGDFGEVLVLDWGIAVSTSPDFKSGLLGETGLGGTPAYMAPEMATGPAYKIGVRSDVYLLGAVLFEILTNKPPHTGRGIRECLKAVAANEIQPTNVTGELMDIALKAMRARPNERFGDVLELKEAIRTYQSHSESIFLSERARTQLDQARERGSYDDYAQAIFGFNQALELWHRNQPAIDGVAEARVSYAEQALRNEDYDLGISLLDEHNDAHVGLLKKMEAGRRERVGRQRRLRALRSFVVMLMVTLLGGASIAIYVFSKQAADLRVSQAKAVFQKGEADKNATKARSEKAAADAAKAQAVSSAERAESARLEALSAQARANMEADNARLQEAVAHVSAYRLAMGLAPRHLEQDNFGKARAILEAEQNSVRRKLRHFEWGRLQHLATRLDIAYSAELGNGSDAQLTSVDCDRTGDLIVAGSRSGQLYVWRMQPQLRRRVVELGEPAQAIALSPDGTFVAVAHGDAGAVDCWALPNEGEPTVLRRFQPHEKRVNHLEFAPDGRSVLSCSNDGTALVWDIESGQVARTLRGHLGPVNDTCFSTDGQWIATASDDGTARVWSSQPGEPTMELERFEGHAGPVYCVAFDRAAETSNSLRVVSGGEQLMAWSSRAKEIMAIARRNNDTPREVFLNVLVNSIKSQRAGDPASQLVATDNKEALKAGLDGLLHWDWQRLDFVGHSSAILDIGFVGGQLVSAGQDNTIRVWDARLEDGPGAGAVSTESTRNAAASSRLIKTLAGHGSTVTSMCFPRELPDEIISSSYDRTVRRWEVSKYQRVRNLDTENSTEVTASALTDDSRWLAAAYADGVAKLFDVSNDRLLATLDEGHEYLTFKAIYFDGGRKVLTVGGDGRTVVWDTSRGVELQRLDRTGFRGVAALADDERLLATGSVGNTVQLWDLPTGTLRAEALKQEVAERQQRLRQVMPRGDKESESAYDARVLQRTPDVSAIAFSPDGRYLVVGDTTGDCWICDPNSGAVLDQFRAHQQTVNAIVFLPDQPLPVLLTASDDRTVAGWRLEPGSEGSPGDAGAQTVKTVKAVEIPRSRLPHPRGVILLKAASQPAGGLAIFTVCAQPQTVATTASPEPKLAPSKMEVRRWRWDDLGQPERTLAVTADRVNSIDLDQSGGELRMLLSCVRSGETELREWDGESNEAPLLWSDNRRRGLIATGLFSRPDPGVLTVGGSGARRWSRVLGQRMLSFRPHGRLTDIGFLPPTWGIEQAGDTPRLALRNVAEANASPLVYTASVDGSIKIWRTDEATADSRGRAVWRLEGGQADDQGKRGHLGGITCVSAATLGGQPTLLTGSTDSTAKLWQQAPNGQWQVVRTLAAHGGPVRQAFFLPGSQHALTAGDDRRGLIWSLNDPNLPPLELAQTGGEGAGHEGAILSAAASADGRWIATGGEDHAIHLWDAMPDTDPSRPSPAVRHVAKLVGHSQSVLGLAFSRDRRRLFSSAADGLVQIWDLDALATDADGATDADAAGAVQVLLSLSAQQGAVNHVTPSLDGRFVTTAHGNGAVLVWDSVDLPPALLVPGSFLTYEIVNHPQLPVASRAVVSAPTLFRPDAMRLVVRMKDPDEKWQERLAMGGAGGHLRIDDHVINYLKADGQFQAVGEIIDGASDRLEVRFQAAATHDAVEAVLRSVTYECRTQLESDDTRTVLFELLSEDGASIGNQVPEQRLISLLAPERSGQ
ncbi:MAG: protein kinase [Planctomycetales bacterium]|nr:protein kinase [Planctomycetales bacterium]